MADRYILYSALGSAPAALLCGSPRMGEVVRCVDADPRLAAFWSERYPYQPGWDRL